MPYSLHIVYGTQSLQAQPAESRLVRLSLSFTRSIYIHTCIYIEHVCIYDMVTTTHCVLITVVYCVHQRSTLPAYFEIGCVWSG